MPRLSIVVPFENDTNRLETTLLSILENRPDDSELILVHRGNYEDPYHLENDELIVIEGDRDSSLVELVNEGVRAACASVVHVLPPGCSVEMDWCEEAIDLFRDTNVGSVCIPLTRDGESICGYGLDSQWLPRRSVANRRRVSAEVSPFLYGGCFRRRLLLSLDGFFDDGSVESAESELGLAIRALGLRSEIASENESIIGIDADVELQPTPSYAAGNASARIAQAYAHIENSDVQIESFIARIGHVAGGLMSPATVAERLGWALGVRDHSLVRPIQERIERAESQLDAWRASTQVRPMRRAA